MNFRVLLKTKVIISNIFLLFFLINCNKSPQPKVNKEEWIAKDSINEKQIETLKNGRWKLRKSKVIDQYTQRLIFEKDFDHLILSFKNDSIQINEKSTTKIDYKKNLFTINDIDTLTNRFQLFHLRDGQLTLRNYVYYIKNYKTYKAFVIELELTTDILTSNEDFYKRENNY